ncbi:hypothetical protein G9A89_012449 [Geosiphon pyriformis]|nr:hypothetical protein G9A89_012449 [Geosiphon pyriformis]
MEATASSTTSKKKTPKGAFYGPVDVVLSNIKHSDDEKDISLSKSGSSDSIYSDVESLSGENEDVSMSGVIGGSFLDLAAITPKTNIEIATSLAKEKGIDVNSNLKRQEIRSDQTVVIEEISMDTPKNIIVVAVSKFGEIKSIKIQLIGMWQKTVMEFAELDQANLLASK